MTFPEYWDILCATTPALANDKAVARIGVPSLRKSLEAAYNAGKAEADARRKAADDFRRAVDKAVGFNPFDDLFSNPRKGPPHE